MRGFGSSSRFLFLYRCIVVSLYRFLVLALWAWFFRKALYKTFLENLFGLQ